MSYLVDTNVISELHRRDPNARVLRWIHARPPSSLYLSVLTLGELRKGIDGLTESDKKRKLLDWLEIDLPAYFAGRILPIDVQVSDRWGRLVAKLGRPLPAIDSLLAATALQHGLTMVTRNLKDFAVPELLVLDPWAE